MGKGLVGGTMGTKFSGITLQTTNVQELASFYTAIGLNFRYEEDGKNNGYFSAQYKNVKLNIVSVEDDSLTITRNGQKIIYKQLGIYRLDFDNDDIDQLEANLLKNGWRNNMILRDYKRGLLLKDPDGNDVYINMSLN